jgi:hypothetical protein
MHEQYQGKENILDMYSVLKICDGTTMITEEQIF